MTFKLPERDDVLALAGIVAWLVSFTIVMTALSLNGLSVKPPSTVLAFIITPPLIWLSVGRKAFAECRNRWAFFGTVLWLLLVLPIGILAMQKSVAYLATLPETPQQHTATVLYLDKEYSSCYKRSYGKYWVYYLEQAEIEIAEKYCSGLEADWARLNEVREDGEICVALRDNWWAWQSEFLHAGRCGSRP